MKAVQALTHKPDSIYPIFFGLSLVFSALLFSACSNTPKSREPFDLKKIENKITVEKLWQKKLPSLNHPDKNNKLSQDDKNLWVTINNQSYQIDKTSAQIINQTELSFESLFGNLIDEKGLYILGSKGEITALDLSTLTSIWQINLNAAFSAPLAQDRDSIYARMKNGMTYRIDKKTGKILWDYKIIKNNSLAIDHQNEALLPNNQLYLTTNEGQFLIFNQRDLYTGLEAKPISLRLAFLAGYSPLDKLSNMKVLIEQPTDSSLVAYVSIFNHSVHKINLNNQNIVFSEALSSLFKPTIFDNQLIVINEKTEIISIDKDSGEQIWQIDDLSYRITAPLIRYQDLIVASDLDGYLHFIEPNNAEIMARFRNKSSAIQTEALIDKSAVEKNPTLYYLDNAGFLTAIQINSN